MAQRDPKVLQLLIRKVWKDFEIDIILGEYRGILAEAQCVQPPLHVDHVPGPLCGQREARPPAAAHLCLA